MWLVFQKKNKEKEKYPNFNFGFGKNVFWVYHYFRPTSFWKHTHTHTASTKYGGVPVSLSTVTSHSPSYLKADNGRLSSARAPNLSVAPSHCHPATINNSQAEIHREGGRGGRAESSEERHRGREQRKQKTRTEQQMKRKKRELEEEKVWDEEGESNSIMDLGGKDERAGGREAQHMLLLQQASINSSSNLSRKKKKHTHSKLPVLLQTQHKTRTTHTHTPWHNLTDAEAMFRSTNNRDTTPYQYYSSPSS